MKRPITYLSTALILFVTGLLSACSKSTLTIPEYVEYVRSPGNGLNNSVTKGGYEFSLLYEPADYVALKELRNVQITAAGFDSTLTGFTDYLYFNFAIRPGNDRQKILDRADSASFETRFNYFSFDVYRDLFLVSKTDTLPCLLHQFINPNEISPEYHFELMFDLPGHAFLSRESIYFIYEDRVLNSGKITIPIETKKIKSIPQLKI